MNWQRLADEVIRRRTHLGYATRAAFAEATGFAPKTLGDLENVRRQNFDRVTLARLEKALAWPEGRSQQLLDTPDEWSRAYVPAGEAQSTSAPDGRRSTHRTHAYVPVETGTGPAELLTPAGIARYLYRDDLVLVALLERSGLDEGARFRLILRIRAARERQNADLLNEVAEAIRAAGGLAPDPAYPPTWLMDDPAPATDGQPPRPEGRRP